MRYCERGRVLGVGTREREKKKRKEDGTKDRRSRRRSAAAQTTYPRCISQRLFRGTFEPLQHCKGIEQRKEKDEVQNSRRKAKKHIKHKHTHTHTNKSLRFTTDTCTAGPRATASAAVPSVVSLIAAVSQRPTAVPVAQVSPSPSIAITLEVTPCLHSFIVMYSSTPRHKAQCSAWRYCVQSDSHGASTSQTHGRRPGPPESAGRRPVHDRRLHSRLVPRRQGRRLQRCATVDNAHPPGIIATITMTITAQVHRHDEMTVGSVKRGAATGGAVRPCPCVAVARFRRRPPRGCGRLRRGPVQSATATAAAGKGCGAGRRDGPAPVAPRGAVRSLAVAFERRQKPLLW